MSFHFADFTLWVCGAKVRSINYMLSCAQSLTWCHLPSELPHWWGGRRGRTGGGGAILWGATDRDGMGDQGKGHRGVSGEATPHAVTTLRHHTRHPPHPNISLFISSCLFVTSFTPLFNFLLWWTDLCMPLLDSKGGSMLQTVFVLFAKLHDLGAERWCSKRQQNESQVKTYNWVFTSCIISESWFWRRIFRGWLTRICLFVLYFFIC